MNSIICEVTFTDSHNVLQMYSVGSALRNNPFAPFVPCHRVIASDLTLGGFYGEWGTAQIANSKCSQKIEMLKDEGVAFDKGTGKLVNKEGALW